MIKKIIAWFKNLFSKKKDHAALHPVTPEKKKPEPRQPTIIFDFKCYFNRPQLTGKVYNFKKQYYRIIGTDGGKYLIEFI